MQFVPLAQDGFNLACHHPLCHDLHLLILFQTLERGDVGTLLSGAYGVGNESRLNEKSLARESWSQLEKIGVIYDQNSDPRD
jgi:hypothetical protein